MRLFFFTVLLVITGCGEPVPSATDNDIQSSKKESIEKQSTLQIAREDELLKAAVALCASKDPNDLELLCSLLRDRGFLLRLDSAETYNYHPGQLRLHKILIAVAQVPGGKGEDVLMRIGSTKVFDVLETEHVRIGAVVRASGEIRNPSQKFLDFLDAQANTGIVGESTVIWALTKMRSLEVCKRIHRWFHAPRLQDEFICKLSVLLQLYEVRNEPTTVALFTWIASEKIDDGRLRNMLVFTIFDEKFPADRLGNIRGIGEEWPKAPSYLSCSTEVLQQTKALGELCLGLDIDHEAKTVVMAAIKRIDTILEFRRSGGPERIAKWIVQLDDKSFSVRDKATSELIKCGNLAELALRNALQQQPPLEVQLRIKAILARLDATGKTGSKQDTVVDVQALFDQLYGPRPSVRRTRPVTKQ